MENNFEQKVNDLINKISLAKKKEKRSSLPSECYFLTSDEILCEKRKFGDSRYPYSCDGLTLWAYSSGNIKIEESTFNILLDFTEGKEPNIAFYFGERKNDSYFPVSITGAGKLPFESNVERHTVFTPNAVYYFTLTYKVDSCVRMFVDKNKNVRFSVYIKNKTNNQLDTYLSSYFNCMLSHSNYEYIETKWYRSAKVIPDGFQIKVTECIDRNTCLEHEAHIYRDVNNKVYSTTSHSDYCGGMHNQLCCSTSLQLGKFEQNKKYTEFTDTAISGDIIPLMLNPNETYCVSYTLSLSSDHPEKISTSEIDELVNEENFFGKNIPDFKAEGKWNNIEDELFSSFIKNVFRQTEFCSRAKNYAGPYIGIRDIFQQLEASLIWIPSYAREKIIEALNYIGENGRAPRQYSYSKNNILPAMDLREFIDQGVWIISTVYKYLAYTNDYSILDEQCSYYKFNNNKVEFSSQRDSVLSHLVRICDYLSNNLDKDTNCLRALYGDWNDALDGLGKTNDSNKEFGSGVSVMATLQFYQNLREMSEFFSKLGKENEANKYLSLQNDVREGLLRYAVVSKNNERKILHGWFDNRDGFVGSFADYDGLSRDGLTSNAFWVISGMLSYDKTLKDDICNAFDRLDSKFGFKTFNPYFAKGNDKIGRINRLPEGTAENGATYIHAALFGIWSLFEMNEYEKAWEQLYKVLPITHDFISTSPFVMPNSYSFNSEKGFDGESMSDWFTGSGCVLIKVLIWYAFGIRANLNEIWISPPKYIPFDKMTLTLSIKGNMHTIKYEKQNNEIVLFLDGINKNEIIDKEGKVTL